MTLPRSTQQLTEYITAIGAPPDESTTATVAVRLAATAFAAHLAAAVVDGAVRACTGLAPGSIPVGLTDARAGDDVLVVDGLGMMHAIVADLGGSPPGMLIVARRNEPFSIDDRYLTQAMAESLGLAIRGLHAGAAGQILRAEHERDSGERARLLDTLGARQRLLETLLGVQRAIANRKPLREILDTATAGAAGLLDQANVTLVLADARTGALSAASSATGSGTPAQTADPLVLSAAAEAMDAACVVARTGGGAGYGCRSVLAAPVSVRGIAAGALTADTVDRPGQTIEHRELLTAFAQQVSLALADARTAAAIHDASHDRGTGLPNRALFLDQLRQAIDAGSQQASDVTVLLVDLDRFKLINDTVGYRGGDEVLAGVVERIRGCLRAGDLVARLGGDEFGVLLEGARSAAGARVARAIVGAFREPFQTSGRTVCVTACVGIAAGGTSSADADDLLNSADVALSRAKQAGTGRTVIFEPHMRTEILERLSLLDDLQQALGRDEVRLQYQPLVHLGSGLPVGVEALARWRHPQRGNVSPATFIPLAEETGLIVELGLWVLREGCRQIAQWRGTVPEMRLNVNVSARQAMSPEFVSDVAKTLADVDLPPSMLTLELTETVLMGDPDLAQQQLRQLKDLGVRLSIDDFGTGYSSLSYLRQFPVDQLKIDRNFVAGIAGGGDQLAVTRTVMELGHTLRLETVAEGIEEVAQLDTLRRIGCDLGQGFHLARPMEAGAVREFFERITAGDQAAADRGAPADGRGEGHRAPADE